MSELGAQGARGAVVSLAGQAGKLLLNFVSLVVLSRILTPRDYGLVAIVLAIVGIGEFLRDMGLSTAAIQAPEVSTAQRSNLWWWNTALGTAAGLICGALAPVVAHVYAHPELVPIMLCLSANLVIAGATTQFRVDLVRRMAFGRIAACDIAASSIALVVAIVAAVLGSGYWALVAQQSVTSVLSLTLIARVARWRPRTYDRSVSTRSFMAVGLPAFGSSVLTYLAGNADTALLGRTAGSTVVGVYNRGIQLVRFPMNQLRSVLNTVALSTLSKVQSDRELYLRYLARAQLPLVYLVGVAGTWVAVNARDLVPIILGRQWGEAIPVVALFAMGDAIATLASAGAWIYLSSGNTKALMRYTIGSSALKVVMFVVASPFGLVPMAGVYAVSALILWPASLVICGRQTGVHTGGLLRASFRVFAVFVAAGGGTFLLLILLHPTHGWLRLAVSTAIYLAILALVTLIAEPVRRDLLAIVGVLRLLSPTGKRRNR